MGTWGQTPRTPKIEIFSMSLLARFSTPTETEKNRDFFECGHSIAQAGWFCSTTRKIRCAICDPRKSGLEKIPKNSTPSGSGPETDSVPPTLAASVEGEGGDAVQFAFCEVTTPNGAYLVATRFPSDWTASSGNRRINRRAGIMFGWPDDLGDDRPRSLDEWREQIRKTAEGIKVRG